MVASGILGARWRRTRLALSVRAVQLFEPERNRRLDAYQSGLAEREDREPREYRPLGGEARAPEVLTQATPGPTGNDRGPGPCGDCRNGVCCGVRGWVPGVVLPCRPRPRTSHREWRLQWHRSRRHQSGSRRGSGRCTQANGSATASLCAPSGRRRNAPRDAGWDREPKLGEHCRVGLRIKRLLYKLRPRGVWHATMRSEPAPRFAGSSSAHRCVAREHRAR